MSGAGPILLAAGGTGGHVFPAQALAEELLARGRRLALATDPRGDAYRGALGRIESHRVRSGTASGRRLGGALAGLVNIGRGFFEARALLERLRPAAVVGFGGYPSLPTMLAASRAGLPTLIHEQNAVLGRVNRLLAGRVSLIATSFPDTERLAARDARHATLVGNPVREEVLGLRDIPYQAPAGGEPIYLLVTGGSQGATVFGQVVPPALAALPEALRGRLRVTQQCRPADLELVRMLYRAAGIEADLAAFFHDLPARLGRAHLLIGRAGASTVAELAVAGRPAILVPYPHAADGHQSRNAEALARAGGAWAVDQDRFTAERLAERLGGLFAEPGRLLAAAAAARAWGRPRAAVMLADLVERLAPGNGGSKTSAAAIVEREKAA